MDALTKRFFELVSIPSPSGKEREVGTYIQQALLECGIEAKFDGTGTLNDSNSGNLVARLKGLRPATVLFVAHMDTVETGEKPIVPRIENGIIKSDGTTILGADNKGSVAALIEALGELSKNDDRPSIVAVFTSREETGKMGVSVLDLPDTIDLAFNMDGEEPIGRFIYQTLGEIPFTLTVHGKASHAASAPEKGINALKAAAAMITRLPIGRTPEGKVLNIGKVKGGAGNNVVPDRMEMTGQVRAFTTVGIEEVFTEMEHIVSSVCGETGCRYDLVRIPDEGTPPAALAQDHPIVEISRRATEAIGLPFSLEKGYFSADANFLAVRYPTITVIRGSTNPHSFDESMSVDVLQQLKKLIISIAQECGR